MALSTVLAPVDFSESSGAALRCAAALTAHLSGRLIVAYVEDPLVTEAVAVSGTATGDTERDARAFVTHALTALNLDDLVVEYAMAAGSPAREILRIADESGSDLIVMSTHGSTRMRRLFFGSTTERVLRETRVPVLTTPAAESALQHVTELRRAIRRIIVPVDLSPASGHQMRVATSFAAAMRVPLILLHVVERVRSPAAAKHHLGGIDLERRSRAEEALAQISASLPATVDPEMLVVYGDPAEEIWNVARDRQAGLIVMGLHGSPVLGPRMGSVTYRVLCLAHALILALPPEPDASRLDPASVVLSRHD